MSLADSWIPDTNPIMLSLKTSITIAAEAPRPVSSSLGDLSMRIDTTRMTQIRTAVPWAVCRNPLIGLFCQAGRDAAIWKKA